MIRGASPSKPAALVRVTSGGDWQPDQPYDGSTIVRHKGASYLSTGPTQGDVPGESPGKWALLAQDGKIIEGGEAMAPITRTDGTVDQAKKFAEARFAAHAGVAQRAFLAGHDAARAEMTAANAQVVRLYTARESDVIEARLELTQQVRDRDIRIAGFEDTVAELKADGERRAVEFARLMQEQAGQQQAESTAVHNGLKQQMGDVRRAADAAAALAADRLSVLNEIRSEATTAKRDADAARRELADARATIAAMIAQEDRAAEPPPVHPSWLLRSVRACGAAWRRVWSGLNTPFPRSEA